MRTLLKIEPAARTREVPALRPDDPPLGLYVHIPFCVRKCHYCDFNSGPVAEESRERYLEALCAEIRNSPWAGEPARTLFFGGGTPSELTTPQLTQIVTALRDTFPFHTHTPTHPHTHTPEWTIECNPGTVTPGSLREMRELGFNRVSLGVQSFHDHHLEYLGRIHSAADAEEAYGWVRAAGFDNVSVDLMFGLPHHTMEEWQRDVERALALCSEHLSLYGLTIEKGTDFGRRHARGELPLPDDDTAADMYEWIMDRLDAEGFEQYEISNFARPGRRCEHNRIYWRHEPFIGFGVSAASFAGGARWTNTGNMHRYVATAPTGLPDWASEERLEGREAAGEAMMVGLRTKEGVNLSALSRHYGLDWLETFGPAIERLTGYGLLTREGDRLRLTRRGILLANEVCAEFL
jgi:oxygen-independent coproporphyrinogen-3 oxidase